jgi:signal transduction histidine kinase
VPTKAGPSGASSVKVRGAAWLVEDSPLEAEMARRVLSSGFDVEAFSDGATMLERLSNQGPPDILVLDWQLPGMSGIEVCQFLRRSMDEMSLPILMLTVQGHKPDIVEGLTAGANDYVTKPYDPEELTARATGLFRMRRLYEQLRVEREQREELLARAQEASARAEQANQAKDDFLATVSHELRTPLNAIVGWVTLLRGGNLSADKSVHALATIDRNARAQTQLIDDLLDVSRIIAGKLRLNLEPTALDHPVRAAVEAVRLQADARQVRIACELQPKETVILGDAFRLQQVVWNLLVNAIKFSRVGGLVEVTLRTREGSVELLVADHGQGIDKDVLPYIFDRFRQANASLSRSHGGLGLGLAIVRHLVQSHGGSVKAESDGQGRGATFVVSFPMLSAPPEGIREPVSSPTTLAPNYLQTLRILFVDDDADSRDAVTTLLQHYGADVLTVGSVEEALAALDRAIPDVLLSDIGMPDEDGLSFLRRVRARSVDNGGRVPAIALTAYARAEDRTKALMAGFNTHVAKPVEAAELVMAIANLTGRFQSAFSERITPVTSPGGKDPGTR